MRALLHALIFWCSLYCEGIDAYVIQPNTWEFRGHDIGFEVARRNTKPDASSAPRDPILLLNGFGVGSFHQHRLISHLLGGTTTEDDVEDRAVYGIDYLGQGRSWPKDCQDGESPSEEGLRYSADMWLEQIIQFLEEVVLPEQIRYIETSECRVHVVGNSVGGYLAVYLANKRPDLVASLCLLNPTPVWGLNLPGWSGHLPAPRIPKTVGRFLFDKIRDLNTIDKYLETAYCRKGAYDEDLMNQIRGCTLGNGGHVAFASIMWSPPLNISEDEKGSFQDCLGRLQCDVLLVFGKDDPWCKPAFGKKMLQALEGRTRSTKQQLTQRYIEVENTGHCPNHEAPQAVASVVRAWTSTDDRSASSLSLCQSAGSAFKEEWGETNIAERQEADIELSFIDRLAVTFV